MSELGDRADAAHTHCSNAFGFLPKLDDALWLSGPDPSRYEKPTLPWILPLGDHGPSCRFWNNFRRCAGLGRDAQTSVKRRYEPKDGRNTGGLSDCLGLLRFIDCIPTGDSGQEFDDRVSPLQIGP